MLGLTANDKRYQILMCWDGVGHPSPRVIRRDKGYDTMEDAERMAESIRTSHDHYDFYKSVIVADITEPWPVCAKYWESLEG